VTNRALLGGLLSAVVACGGGSSPPGAAAGGGAGTAAAGTTPGGTSGASMAGGSSGGSAGAAADPDPVLPPTAMAELKKLAYDTSPPPADPSNRFESNVEAQAFGQRMFFDPLLSGPLLERDNDGGQGTLGKSGEAGRVSCSGCHVPESNFVDTRSPHRQISLAAQWGKRRAQTLLGVASLPLLNWDGRRDSIWSQAVGVMENSSEFNSGRLFVAEQIFRLYRAEYEKIFGPMPPLDDATRFPQLEASEAGCVAGPVETAACRGKPGDKADYDGMAAKDQDAVTTVVVNVAKSIAAYVSLLRCGPSRFDAWLAGDTEALTRSEQRGAALFVGAGKCASCHSGPNFTDGQFHNVGLRPAVVAVAFTDTGDDGAKTGVALNLEDPLNSKGPFSDGDRGALPAAVTAAHEGAFRTPTLRCISQQPSFMHTAQLGSLAQVMEFFNRGGDPLGFPGTNEIAPLGLSDLDKADLVAFMKALQGEGPEAKLLSPGD